MKVIYDIISNEGENDGELLLNMCIVCHMLMHHKS